METAIMTRQYAVPRTTDLIEILFSDGMDVKVRAS
jgi:hypothetical protein